MGDRILTTEQLFKELDKYTFKQLHIHHTWKPVKSQFKGDDHLKWQSSMREHHVKSNGWADIGQHLTLMPDGKFVTGRPFNKDPASIKGWNDNALAVEMMGNFDIRGTGQYNELGYDTLEGEQEKSILELIRYFGERFGYENIKFHRENASYKTCPGTSLDKEILIAKAKGTKLTDPIEATSPTGNFVKKESDTVTLKNGSRGNEVKKLQSDLNALGFNAGKADGIYGKNTEAAVKTFQKAYGLAVDGIAGKNTFAKLEQVKRGKVLNYKALYEKAKKQLDQIKKILEG